jgi:ribonuclease P protein component
MGVVLAPRSGRSFPKDVRVRNRSEYAHLRRFGRKTHRPHFIVYCLPTKSGPTRLGLTVSRKVGGAVQRNRVKRLVREFFRQNRCRIGPGFDISIIAKRCSFSLSYDDVSRQLEFLTGLNDCQGTSNGQADISLPD